MDIDPQSDGSHVKGEAEMGVILPQARDTWGSQKLEEARKYGDFRGSMAPQHLDSGLLPQL